MALTSGVSYAEFWGLTPWITQVVCRAHAKTRRDDYRLAMLTAWQTAQLSLIDPKHFPSFAEFMNETAPGKGQDQTQDEIAANILKWASQAGIKEAPDGRTD